MKELGQLAGFRIAVVPAETDNEIDQNSTAQEIVDCPSVRMVALTDYFQDQNDEVLPESHWSFLLYQNKEGNFSDVTGCNIPGIHQGLKVGKVMMKLKLASVGNPDFNQDPNQPMWSCEPNKEVEVESFKEASRVCRKFIDDNNLGGGNWHGGQVYVDGNQVASVSYNGRIWDMEGMEIKASNECC